MRSTRLLFPATFSLQFLQKNQNLLNKMEAGGVGRRRDALISAG